MTTVPAASVAARVTTWRVHHPAESDRHCSRERTISAGPRDASPSATPLRLRVPRAATTLAQETRRGRLRRSDVFPPARRPRDDDAFDVTPPPESLSPSLSPTNRGVGG
ncbi:hypothetical protein MRX96_005029 [Rhipicephalus microplus]